MLAAVAGGFLVLQQVDQRAGLAAQLASTHTATECFPIVDELVTRGADGQTFLTAFLRYAMAEHQGRSDGNQIENAPMGMMKACWH